LHPDVVVVRSIPDILGFRASCQHSHRQRLAPQGGAANQSAAWRISGTVPLPYAGQNPPPERPGVDTYQAPRQGRANGPETTVGSPMRVWKFAFD
jgi:hypothetical protein